jgi:hypothetical protein
MASGARAPSEVGISVAKDEGGGIFVSYRRRETSGTAGRLADQLGRHFGTGRVFIDVDSIEPGVDFTETIVGAVGACKVLLAVIGPGWLTATDEQGRRRLDDPEDIVRLEIETAIAGRVRVIPVLVENAVMPRRQELPETLGALTRRNAFVIRHESFRHDAERLIATVDGVLNPPGEARGRALPEGGRAGKSMQPTRKRRPATEKKTWQLELLEENITGTKMTFRLRSGKESHLVSLEFPFLGSDIIGVDGERVTRSWVVKEQDIPITLGSTPGFVRVKVSGHIKSVIFTIGKQRLTYGR